jgi:hypothetical protein
VFFTSHSVYLTSSDIFICSGLGEGEGEAGAAGLQAGVRPHRAGHVARWQQQAQQLRRIPQAWWVPPYSPLLGQKLKKNSHPVSPSPGQFMFSSQQHMLYFFARFFFSLNSG